MASSQTGQTGQTSVDTTNIFTTDKKFATRDDVVEWAREVGFANKVSIIISRSDKKTGKRGRSDKLILGCDKGGKYDVESSKVTATKKCSYPFKIRATPSTDGSGWKVQVKCGVHNHGLPDQYEGHPRVGRLTEDEKKHVADLTKLHVAPRHILLSLKEKNSDCVTHVTQLYKHRSILQKAERGPRTEMQQLMQMLDEAKYVSWNRRRDDGSDVLRDVFWAHPDSIKLLNMFPIVLIMDSTYKTNKYRQPLLEILGRATLYFISGERFENRVELNWSLPLEVLGSDIYIVGSTSINDILCLTNIWDAESKLVLWNPITDELNVIPPSLVESVPCTKVIPFIHGIGYDRLRDDYKVIRHVEFDGRSFDFLFDRVLSMEEDLAISKEPLWEIYSLKSNSWKKFDVDMSMLMNPSTKEDIAQFYMDGMCHWWDNVEKDSSDETYFVSFDVSNEVFFTTPMPSQVDDTFDLRLVKRQLVILNGSIALISYSGETTFLHISILGEIGVKESWTKLFIVGPLPHVDYPIGAGKNGDIFFVKKDEELACFNLDTRTIKELGVKGDMSQIVIYKDDCFLAVNGGLR
ncbi:uncharacterized protein LOC123901480 [Trifolium pratense]|uniref:uncharacterized protein LOC123901480 n=1 Tax=Trifolium pratense TaxID=57577 RepID=UPI001E690BA5|nr:uncharacterized protein LOC123901480 [Trifolium pratense]